MTDGSSSRFSKYLPQSTFADDNVTQNLYQLNLPDLYLHFCLKKREIILLCLG